MGEIQDSIKTEEDYEAWFDDSPWRYYNDKISADSNGAAGEGSSQTRFRNPSTMLSSSAMAFSNWPNALSNRNAATKLVAYLNIIL